jgi:hypothetical protein
MNIHIIGLVVFCAVFTCLVISLIYYGAFRQPLSKVPKQKIQWNQRNPNNDFAMLKIKDDRRKIGDRETDYIVFYNPSDENPNNTLNMYKDPQHKKPRRQDDLNFNKLSTWICLILLFSFIIVLASKTGYWLYQVYSWFQ